MLVFILSVFTSPFLVSEIFELDTREKSKVLAKKSYKETESRNTVGVSQTYPISYTVIIIFCALFLYDKIIF